MLNNSLWTWIGSITLMAGLTTVYLILTGFGGTVDCGTFGLHCLFYSVLALPIVIGISAAILWAGVAKKNANSRTGSFARILATITTSVFVLLMVGLMVLIIAISSRN